MRRSISVAVAAWVLGLMAIACNLTPPAVRAQQTAAVVATAVVSGVISDPTGARIPHAAVHLSGLGISRDTATDSLGRFSITAPGGAYKLTISAKGFAAVTRDITFGASDAPLRFDISLSIAPRVDAVSVPIEGPGNSAADNASAIVFQGAQLNLFSNDDATFQKELLALAGTVSSNPTQIYIDGFSGARIPPKSSILSVRINRNSFSAAYDSFGIGRVEISTQPGGEKLHGQINVNATDDVFNAQNPYLTTEPPYYLLNLDGNLSGSINRKTSYFLSASFNDQQNNAALNAVTLNPLNQQVAYSAAVRDPQLASAYALRLDRQISPSNTLTSRYEFNQVNLTNGGLSTALTTSDQAFNSGTTTQTLQVADTRIIGPHIVSESHAQYIRTRLQQGAVNGAPTLLVEGGFNGGGNPSQSLRDDQDHYEFQEALSIDRGAHYLRFGARYRLQREANYSTANYNGQFTFASLAAFAAQQPSQFSITTGRQSASVLTGDFAAYAEDEWKIAAGATLDVGFRLESQSAIPDHVDPAPRVGFSWAMHRPHRQSTFLLLRSGGGLFYDRFSAANLLIAARQNGLSQQTYYVNEPGFYCTTISVCQASPNYNLTALPPATYSLSPSLRAEYGWIGGISVEKIVGTIGTVSANYVVIRGIHQLDSRNINAPLPGTYNPAVPTSGVRPFGGTQNLYQFESEGIQKTQLIYFNSRLNIGKRATAFVSYRINHTDQDYTNASTFASNSYNLSQDYGRAPQPTQQIFAGGTVQLPFGIAGNLFLSTQGGTPFNITTGTDLNGDSIYNDRPAFATAPTASSVLYNTRFGNFDANPQPGEKIIPINCGNSPNLAFLDLSVNRSFKFGLRPAAGEPAPRSDPPYTVTLTVDSPNVLNHRNPGQPEGVLSSPFFGQPTSLNNPFSADTAANRILFLQAGFSF